MWHVGLVGVPVLVLLPPALSPSQPLKSLQMQQSPRWLPPFPKFVRFDTPGLFFLRLRLAGGPYVLLVRLRAIWPTKIFHGELILTRRTSTVGVSKSWVPVSTISHPLLVSRCVGLRLHDCIVMATSSVLVWVRRLYLNIPFSIRTRKDNFKLAMFLFVFDPAISHFPSVCWLQVKGNGSPMTPFRKFYLPSLPSPGPLLRNYPCLPYLLLRKVLHRTPTLIDLSSIGGASVRFYTQFQDIRLFTRQPLLTRRSTTPVQTEMKSTAKIFSPRLHGSWWFNVDISHVADSSTYRQIPTYFVF